MERRRAEQIEDALKHRPTRAGDLRGMRSLVRDEHGRPVAGVRILMSSADERVEEVGIVIYSAECIQLPARARTHWRQDPALPEKCGLLADGGPGPTDRDGDPARLKKLSWRRGSRANVTGTHENDPPQEEPLRTKSKPALAPLDGGAKAGCT